MKKIDFHSKAALFTIDGQWSSWVKDYDLIFSHDRANTLKSQIRANTETLKFPCPFLTENFF